MRRPPRLDRPAARGGTGELAEDLLALGAVGRRRLETDDLPRNLLVRRVELGEELRRRLGVEVS